MIKVRKKKIAFLDRDGVINKDCGYVHKLDELVWMEGVLSGLRKLLELKYELFIVTNQSGIARGYYSEDQFHIFMNGMIGKLKLEGIDILGYNFCPHHPDGLIKNLSIVCECRKPKPKMVQKVLYEEKVSSKDCILIGDKLTDIEAGMQAGIGKLFLLDHGFKSSGSKLFENFKNWDQISEYLDDINY